MTKTKVMETVERQFTSHCKSRAGLERSSIYALLSQYFQELGCVRC